jgi:hypothetical protein
VVSEILWVSRAEDLKFRLVWDRIYDAGSHGTVQYELVIEKLEDHSFWRTFYYTHYNLDFEDANDGEPLEFKQVYPVAHNTIRWEEHA